MSQDYSPAVFQTTPVEALLNPDHGPIEPQFVSWFEERHRTIRSLVARATQDIITAGLELADVKALLAPQEFSAFVATLGLSRATAYRWMSAAALAAGHSHPENLEVSALYALGAKSTPDVVREAFLAKADAGQRVTLQEVQEALRQHRPAPERATPNLVERIVDGMVEAEETRAGRDGWGRDLRAEHVAEEIDRFQEESRVEVAAAVAEWGRACVAGAQPFLYEEEG
jgi:hypothetical protein